MSLWVQRNGDKSIYEYNSKLKDFYPTKLANLIYLELFWILILNLQKFHSL